MGEPAGQRFPHGAIVVCAALSAHFERPVAAFVEFSVHDRDHARRDVLVAEIGDVVRLDPLRQHLQSEQGRQMKERFLLIRLPFPGVFRVRARVLHRHIAEIPGRAALWCAELYLVTRAIGDIGGEQLKIPLRQLKGEQNLAGDIFPALVQAREIGCHGRVSGVRRLRVLLPEQCVVVEQHMLTVRDVAAADIEHGQTVPERHLTAVGPHVQSDHVAFHVR